MNTSPSNSAIVGEKRKLWNRFCSSFVMQLINVSYGFSRFIYSKPSPANSWMKLPAVVTVTTCHSREGYPVGMVFCNSFTKFLRVARLSLHIVFHYVEFDPSVEQHCYGFDATVLSVLNPMSTQQD